MEDTENKVITEEEKVEEPTKKGITPRQIFWIRFVFWVIFAVVLPVAFIIWRFDIFKKDAVSLGGWGILAIIILIVFAIDLLKYIRKGLKPSLATQCLTGFCKVILPLSILMLVVYSIKDNLDAFMQALGCVILCETVAIPINPMPGWVYKSNLDLKADVVEHVGDSFIGRFVDALNEAKAPKEGKK